MSKKTSRALYIGRFQPFHKGHLQALNWILEREEEVIIGIGSAQFSHTLKNPFTLGERLEMIYSVIRKEKLYERVIAIGIPDTDNQHSIWVSLVKSFSPKFKKVYTNDPLSRQLFEENNIPTSGIPFFNRDKYKATKIREMMIKDQLWEDLVPEPVAQIIKEINGVERLKNIAGILTPRQY